MDEGAAGMKALTRTQWQGGWHRQGHGGSGVSWTRAQRGGCHNSTVMGGVMDEGVAARMRQ